MKERSGWTNYEERLGRVTAYIHDHLDEELDLNRLAEVACLSPHHWHRIYHAIHGETIAATVKRLRLHRAAGYLANSAMTIEEIAARSGYKNLQSFTRIFGSVYGLPPAQYRRNGSHTGISTGATGAKCGHVRGHHQAIAGHESRGRGSPGLLYGDRLGVRGAVRLARRARPDRARYADGRIVP